jgi:protein phosphatase-4 regulatory subunit 3
VYELIGQRWTDRGTAFCQGDYDEDARQARLIARAEHSNEILLQCIIRATDVYQRQQGISLHLTWSNFSNCLPETLIVWTEPDGTDYALSFQDMEGCGEVWDFIGEVQRHLQDKGLSSFRTAIVGVARLITAVLLAEEEAASSEAGSSMHVFPAGNVNPSVAAPKLPTPSLGNLHECERIIRHVSRQQHGKEKLCHLLIVNVSLKIPLYQY